MTNKIRIATNTKKNYLVDNLLCTHGMYKWNKYSTIPLDWLKYQYYIGRYDNKKYPRNKRIREYILNRIEKDNKIEEDNIGYISFD